MKPPLATRPILPFVNPLDATLASLSVILPCSFFFGLTAFVASHMIDRSSHDAQAVGDLALNFSPLNRSILGLRILALDVQTVTASSLAVALALVGCGVALAVIYRSLRLSYSISPRTRIAVVGIVLLVASVAAVPLSVDPQYCPTGSRGICGWVANSTLDNIDTTRETLIASVTAKAPHELDLEDRVTKAKILLGVTTVFQYTEFGVILAALASLSMRMRLGRRSVAHYRERLEALTWLLAFSIITLTLNILCQRIAFSYVSLLSITQARGAIDNLTQSLMDYWGVGASGAAILAFGPAFTSWRLATLAEAWRSQPNDLPSAREEWLKARGLDFSTVRLLSIGATTLVPMLTGPAFRIVAAAF